MAAILPFLAPLLIPLAAGYAVLRYRLYDIDVVINRALVYGSLTLMLALVYFGGVTATQALLTNTGRPGRPSTTRRGDLHARHSGTFEPLAPACPELYRPELLSPQVRRGKDARRVLREAARRDGHGHADLRAANGRAGDDATLPHLAVAAPQPQPEARAIESACGPFSLVILNSTKHPQNVPNGMCAKHRRPLIMGATPAHVEGCACQYTLPTGRSTVLAHGRTAENASAPVEVFGVRR